MAKFDFPFGMKENVELSSEELMLVNRLTAQNELILKTNLMLLDRLSHPLRVVPFEDMRSGVVKEKNEEAKT